MATLKQALQAIPVHLIAIIGRENGLGIDSNLSKTALIERVASALSHPATFPNRVEQLTPSQAQALTDLRWAGGRLPARYLAKSYGPLRTLRQIIDAYRQQIPLSPLEQLCIQGLIFFDPASRDLFIPADIEPHLPPLESPAPGPPQAKAGPAPVDLLRHDLTLLLALLQQQPITPLHGRWLPPRFLAHWGRLCRVSPASPHARSELQTKRRRFIHYLAYSAGWLNTLTLTPAAWQWLNQSRSEQLHRLWQVWTTPRPEPWSIFRWPGHTWLVNPSRLLQPVQQALLTIDPSQPDRFAKTLLQQQPHLVDLVPATATSRPELLQETVAKLVRGPLIWLGVLQMQRTEDGVGSREDEVTGDTQAPVSGPQTLLSLTPQGAAWLANEPPPEPDSPPAKFTIQADRQPDPLRSTFTLTLFGGLPEPANLMAALEMGSIKAVESGPPEPPARGHRSPSAYRVLVTAISFVKALHRGRSPANLLNALNRLAHHPLTGQDTALLQHWAEAARRVTLRQAVLLETGQPNVIARLASTRRGRNLIQRTLSPRAVTVDPDRLDQLLRRLTQQEQVPPQMVGLTANKKSDSPSEISSAEAAHLWLVVQVYRQLDQMINLPARTPQQLLDKLAELAGDDHLASADHAAEQTLAALRQALEGRAAFPPWPSGGLPVEESEAIIEQALASSRPLELHYYSAGSDRLTRRVVEPYRLERWRDTLCMVGFCHRAQAERMFRLDRIKEIEIVDEA